MNLNTSILSVNVVNEFKTEKQRLTELKEAEKQRLKAEKDYEKFLLKEAKEKAKAEKDSLKVSNKRIKESVKNKVNMPLQKKEFVASNKSIPIGSRWICAKVPCLIINKSATEVKLKPFNGIPIIISSDLFETNFYELESDDIYVYVDIYPEGRIALVEFEIKPISIKKIKEHFKDNESLIAIIKKAEQDSFHSKGNQLCLSISDYNVYNPTNTSRKLERIGDPIFNRSVRHSPPISKSFTREDFESNISYPAPIGIREEDFAFPSEQNEILKELLTQIFCSKNAPECPETITQELGITILPNTHICLWCGELIDISDLDQSYNSKEHSINFCHRIPELGTRKGNVYIGHCSCNREQGGYSEENRIEQIIRLCKFNPSYKEKILRELM